MTWVKICGITNLEDALEAHALGVQALGFIFAPSPRRVDPSRARDIICNLPASLMKVGVFVNRKFDEVQRIAEACGLNALQFHGQEPPEYCRQVSLPVIKAIGIKDAESLKEMEKYSFASILLDASAPGQAGGTGKTFAWELALEARKKRNFILSGGLNPLNVYRAIQILSPIGVDVCSGVEKVPRVKDRGKMIEFVKEVRKADESAG
ncbi:MAG: phosphoribosylanthranilate isomerase [Deltaproteobacteria bacterium]|nr:phosphoribosylanthranilate isomerase [Deltaproteobacteria bacterium]